MLKSSSRSFTWTRSMESRYKQSRPPLLLTAFTAVGIIYGDIGTSPLYVMNGIFPASSPPPNQEDVVGVVSAIIWTLTIVPLIKYCLIALEFGTGEGEGGPFALFSQMYPPEKPGSEMALPSIHSIGTHYAEGVSAFLTRKYVKGFIKLVALFAAALILSDGILTPAVSVTSAIGGIAIPVPSLNDHDITGISIAILVVIFFSQSFGTSKLGISFAPVVSIWLLLLSGTGIYNITRHPSVLRAFDPSRAIMYFVRVKSISPLSGILLAITGVEALYANLGQFSKGAIRLSFTSWIYPSLLLAYLGQGAQLMINGPQVVSNIFYETIPGRNGGALWWIVWIFGLLATVVASQAMITASFSLIQQMVGLKSFPPVSMVYTSDSSKGQIYAPVVNFLLLIGTVGVTAGFGAGDALTSAYGFAVAGVLISTTFLMTLVMITVKGVPVLAALSFFVLAGFVDSLFFASSLAKIPHGAWFTLILGFLIGTFLLFWTWAKGLEDAFDANNRTKLGQLLIRHTHDAGPISPAIHETSLQPCPDFTVNDLAFHEEPEQIQEIDHTSEKFLGEGALHVATKEDMGSQNNEQYDNTPIVAIDKPGQSVSTRSDPPRFGRPASINTTVGNLDQGAAQGCGSPTRMATWSHNELTINPSTLKGITLSGPLPRLESFSFFHHMGEGIGAPHSFTALLKHQPALPRVVVFLSIRVVSVPYLQEADKFVIDKLRTVSGFYLLTYRVGYRDTLDLRGIAKPTLERIIKLERGNQPPGTNQDIELHISQLANALKNTNHILPHYHCTSKGIGWSSKCGGLTKLINLTRAFLIEEVYRRVSQNFPETSSYVVDEAEILRIGVNALI